MTWMINLLSKLVKPKCNRLSDFLFFRFRKLFGFLIVEVEDKSLFKETLIFQRFSYEFLNIFSFI